MLESNLVNTQTDLLHLQYLISLKETSTIQNLSKITHKKNNVG